MIVKTHRVTLIFSYVALTLAGYVLLSSHFTSPTARVQITWTLAGFIGVLLTSANLTDALHDRAALRAEGRNGDLRVIAGQAIRQEAIRLTQMLTITAIGLYVLTAAPVLTAAQREALHIPEWTPASIVVTAGLLWVVFATVIQAYFDRRTRLGFYQRRQQ
jgi:hypothetical protein